MKHKTDFIRSGGLLLVAGLGLAAPLVINNPYWLSILIFAGINVLLTASLRTIGLLNQTSLGHVGFALIGAYTSALLMMRFGLPFGVTLLLGGLLAGLVALVLSYPFLRVKGIYFAMLTLLTAETFRVAAWNWKDVTGGILGLANIPAPEGFGLVDFSNPGRYYYLMLGVVTLSLIILYRLEHSALGFRWRAIRDAELLAQAVGLNSVQYKVINFVIACFFAGLAGALFAHFQRALSADFNSKFGVITSLYLVLYLFIGGQRRFAGPIVGAVTLTIIAELARPLQEYQPMLIGGLAILTAVFLPDGLVSLPARCKGWFERRLATPASAVKVEVQE